LSLWNKQERIHVNVESIAVFAHLLRLDRIKEYRPFTEHVLNMLRSRSHWRAS